MSWFLRKADGAVFGPVELSELRLWSVDGRIDPRDEISEDERTWVPAANLAELALNWFIPDGPAMLGPYHAMTIAELVAQGQIPPSHPVRRRDNGERTTAAVAVVVPLYEEIMGLKAALAAAGSGTAPEALAAAEARLRELEAHRAAEPVARQMELLLAEAREAEDQRRSVEQECTERVRLADQGAERNAREAKGLRDKLDDANRRHIELLAAYRELNDKYIRLRDHNEAPDGPEETGGQPHVRLY